jgi:hypothetical protein
MSRAANGIEAAECTSELRLLVDEAWELFQKAAKLEKELELEQAVPLFEKARDVMSEVKMNTTACLEPMEDVMFQYESVRPSHTPHSFTPHSYCHSSSAPLLLRTAVLVFIECVHELP